MTGTLLSRWLRCLQAALWINAGLMLSCTAGPFELVSVIDPAQMPPAGGSGDSWGPLMTPDGRFVVFSSAANNLVTTSNGNALPVAVVPHVNVFMRDRALGTTTLVSVNATGTGGGNGESIATAISSNGQYVCFESTARDLVPADTNGLTDIFVRDVIANTITLASASLFGGVGNGVCRGSTMTPDGRYVAFVSAGTNLVANDTNGIPDLFVRDLQTATTKLVSVGAQKVFSWGSSESPVITPDGRYVAFYSTATNLVSGAGASGEVYVRDLVAGTTTWASVSSRTLLGNSNAISYNPAISADGQFVAYETSTNGGVPIVRRGFIARFNLGTGLTDLISTNASVQKAAYEEIRSLEITPDGRFVVFVANVNGTTDATTCIHLWAAQSGAVTLTSGDLNGNVPSNSICQWPAIDPTGRFVAFLSNATNLVTNTVSGDYLLYLRDVQLGTTTLLSADTNGVGSPVTPSTAPRLSADGRLVAFESLDANLVANDRNHDYDVFLHDSVSGTNALISARHPALASVTPNGPSLLWPFPASSSGRYIVFSSDADNLVPNDTNGFRDIFVRDLLAPINILVSIATNGVPANGPSSEPAISADGRYVVFTSSADNLVPGDTNYKEDVFLRDLQNSTTSLVSWNTSHTGPGTDASFSPRLFDGERYVLFRSKASDVAVGQFSGTENLFLRDLQLGTTYAVTTNGVLAASATADGRWIAFGGQTGKVYVWDRDVAAVVYTNFNGFVSLPSISISPDGNRIVYWSPNPNAVYAIDRAANTNFPIRPASPGSRLGLRFSSDSRSLIYSGGLNNTNQIYRYDFQTGTNILLSQSFGPPSGASDSPDLSADGRLVAYRSLSTNLVATADGNGVPDLFVYDSFPGTTALLSASRANATAADNRSLAPLFSPDGRTLLFQSAATDLVGQDFNHGSDLFALALLYATISPATAGYGPTLSWPARPGETYQVQFKNNLADNVWQSVSGTVTVTGNQAQLTDPAITNTQRFYRVVAF